MKKKKQLALMLVIALLMSMLAACGSSSSTATTSSSDAEATEDATESSSASDEEETTASEETETADESDSTAEEETVEAESDAEESTAVYGDYTMNNPDIAAWPVDDGTTITFWWAVNLASLEMDAVDDALAWQMLEEITGYELEFVTCLPASASTNFMLMVAAENYTDVFGSAVSYYSGGASAAVEEEVLLDLSGYIADYIPNLQALMDENPTIALEVSTDEGYIPELFSVTDDPTYSDEGYAIRQDLLDELGLSVPETYDELYDVLTALTSAGYGGMALHPSGVGTQNILLSGYGVYGVYTSVMGAEYPFYVNDGEVKYGHMEEGFREYLEMLNQWYEEGLIYTDFISQGEDMTTDSELILNNKVSVWYSEAQSLTTTQATGESAIDGFEITPLPTTLKEKGSTEYYSTAQAYTETCWSVSTTTDMLYEVLEFFNFTYSDEGSLICNWGEEGVSYVVNDDGSYSFTDVILNSSSGVRAAMGRYVMMGGSYQSDGTRLLTTYDDLAYTASVDCWTTETTSITGIPNGVSLTADEDSEVSAILSDILTYASTMIVKYIIGDEDLDNYDEFLETMESMGIQDTIDIYQAAYDRYLSR